MRHRTLITGAALAASLTAPAATARAAGGYPFGADAGPAGVTTPRSEARYVALISSSGTLIERIARTGGEVLAWRTVRGQLSVPAVAMDGSPGGLSADERTLVLIQPQNRFPVARTHLAVADPATLRTRTFTLKGDFTFDALSPDDGADATPFIHALDTSGRRAFCIDLDALRGSSCSADPGGSGAPPGRRTGTGCCSPGPTPISGCSSPPRAATGRPPLPTSPDSSRPGPPSAAIPARSSGAARGKTDRYPSSRSSRLSTLPVAVRGSSEMNSTSRGTL